MTPKSALLTTFCPEQMPAKVAIWGQFFESPNKLLKMHVLGQNELNKRSKHTRAPKSAQNAFFVTILVLGKDWPTCPGQKGSDLGLKNFLEVAFAEKTRSGSK